MPRRPSYSAMRRVTDRGHAMSVAGGVSVSSGLTSSSSLCVDGRLSTLGSAAISRIVLLLMGIVLPVGRRVRLLILYDTAVRAS